jgi:hypothetical protein
VYQHQQQLYGFASAAVQTTLIHALLKAHNKSQPGHLLAYEAWGRLRGSGKQLDAQCLLAGRCACVSVCVLGWGRGTQQVVAHAHTHVPGYVSHLCRHILVSHYYRHIVQPSYVCVDLQ